MGEVDGLEEVNGRVPHGMMAMDVEKLATTGALFEAVEEGHRKGPGAQTSEDAGVEGEGVKGAYGGTWCDRWCGAYLKMP